MSRDSNEAGLLAVQRSLEASELRYRRLFESAKDGILILDATTGKIVDVNPFVTTLTGYSRKDFLGQDLWNIGSFEDVEASKALFADLQQKGYVRYDDLPLRTRAGQRIEVEFVSNVYLAGGQNVIQCNIRDVTAHKRAERALQASESRNRTLIEASANGILIIDAASGAFTLANPALRRMLGCTEEELDTVRAVDLHPDGPRQQVMTMLDLSRYVEEARAVPVQWLKEDGAVVHAEVDTIRITLDDRPSCVSFFRDVTRQKQAEEEQARLEEQLRTSQKLEAIGSLAGGIAHDFNNLLAVILSYTGFAMERAGEGTPLASDLQQIDAAAERAAVLTRQLLAFSRKQILQPVPLNLNQTIVELEKMLHRILGEDIVLAQRLTPKLGLTLVDPGQIEQVLMNLVVNARDAMPQGGKLFIETSRVDLDEAYTSCHLGVEPGPYVQVVVTDTGCGMDKLTRSRIFEPFFTTKDKDKGTGLGLSTAYGIIKQSGGDILVYSEPGHGTTFRIYLPLDLAAVRATPLPPPAAPERSTGTETILLVEDDATLRKAVARILAAAGYTVLPAPGGDEALLTCRRHDGPIHLLLTDVVMPQMSGTELAHALSVTRSTLKVLYMSGYTNEAMFNHGVLAPGICFLSKPFTPASLTRRVREVLDSGNTAHLAEENVVLHSG